MTVHNSSSQQPIATAIHSSHEQDSLHRRSDAERSSRGLQVREWGLLAGARAVTRGAGRLWEWARERRASDKSAQSNVGGWDWSLHSVKRRRAEEQREGEGDDEEEGRGRRQRVAGHAGEGVVEPHQVSQSSMLDLSHTGEYTEPESMADDGVT